MDETKQILKSYILEEFLPGEDPEELTESTPLLTGGIIDSLGTLKLVAFLGERFNVNISAHEVAADYMNTIADIAELVHSKL